jgi:hypothetical protein
LIAAKYRIEFAFDTELMLSKAYQRTEAKQGGKRKREAPDPATPVDERAQPGGGMGLGGGCEGILEDITETHNKACTERQSKEPKTKATDPDTLGSGAVLDIENAFVDWKDIDIKLDSDFGGAIAKPNPDTPAGSSHRFR